MAPQEVLVIKASLRVLKAVPVMVLLEARVPRPQAVILVKALKGVVEALMPVLVRVAWIRPEPLDGAPGILTSKIEVVIKS